ncbi:MAG: SDR family NAD(P)-dependent oxidoreductase [Nocardioides sp.]|nr:SDR family NAD(P)-dependent oxidoreductase [Nocardioides sp.]
MSSDRTGSVPSNMAGRVVAITGGARGIGRCTAEAFLSAGATVIIGDLDTQLCAATAEELSVGARTVWACRSTSPERSRSRDSSKMPSAG